MSWNGDSHFGLDLGSPSLLLKVPFKGFSHCIRAGEHFPFPVPDRRMATNSFQLSNDVFGFNPGSKSQGDEAADCLGLRRRTTSRLSYLIEDLKKLSLLIFVHRHIEISTTGPDLSGRTMDHILASFRLPLPLAQLLFFLRSIPAR